MPVDSFQVGRLHVEIQHSKEALGRAAAERAAALMRGAIRERGRARIIVGTGPSQDEVIGALVAAPDLDWARVEVFHMDEYVGLPAEHPASFRRWLKTHVAGIVRPGVVHYLDESVAGAYAELLAAAPVDVCFIGFGENGHIAFNDPHAADFNDPVLVKRVALDERCRRQQVGEGHFASLSDVPPEAVTLTCPALMSAAHLICSVPDRRKAEAVKNALEGPITPSCPASLVRTHPDARLYLDPESAALLSPHRGAPRDPHRC